MALQPEASVLLTDDDKKAVGDVYLKMLALWEKAGWSYYQTKALVAYSEAIAQTNHDESAIQLRKAAEIFRALGAKRDLDGA